MGFAGSPPSTNAVLLSNIQSLTLRANQKTSHRRVPAIPQLECVGGNANGKYEVDVMRCINQGSSYGTADVEWSCTASLPQEFKLGSTDVICEGYLSAEDEYVLKGSCGVRYRLVLTERGEAKYARNWFSGKSRQGERLGSYERGIGRDSPSLLMGRLPSALFWATFVSIAVWIAYSMLTQRNARQGFPRGPRRPRAGRYGGGGDGGGDDPPPPYDSQPPRRKFTRGSQTTSQNWRPGFWTGVGAGAAAGYALGGAGSSSGHRTRERTERPLRDDGNNSGSSRSAADTESSGRYASTGFGSSSRR